MPSLTAADTIRILVSTDNHVGYNERDPVRGDDSWKSFHEVMCLAKERDVDMVLLAGDLFHENKPSRKSMYQVMRSLRMNCYGDKPCELEMLSDASENFQGAFNHVNYEDMDINVAIPVFSIHGNHDDPSGEGHLAALDILQVSGLVNYYGRTPESDNIQVKPVLLQKGRTKLALYGMSNVRDERLFRTFRDGKVKFFQPSLQKSDWFNLMSVHQNHHAHTETGYLPENFLPDFLDLVIWGHEHECIIEPRLNPETNFHVMQPGSSVATSLVPGEAVPKQVAILSITGREFKTEPIRLKSVRPFVTREIVLHEEKEAQRLAKKENNRTELTRFLIGVVEELIEQAKNDWIEAQEDVDDEELEIPLPLVRLRVEVSTPGGGSFDCENPQRFSNRFVGKVANVNDVIQFYRKKKAGTALRRGETDAPDEAAISHLSSLDTVKVEKLVREFLTAQSLTILPQNSFGDAVSQFVDKDDKHAMEMFVNESLESQIKHLLALDQEQDDDEIDYGDGEGRSIIQAAMDKYRAQLEDMFAKGSQRRTRGQRRFKPKPDGWDSEFDGPWEDQPGALIISDDEADEVVDENPPPRRGATTTTGRGRGRGGRTARGSAPRATSTRKAATPTTSSSSRTRRRQAVSDDEDEDEQEDAIMLDDISEDGEENSDSLFVRQTPVPRQARSTSSTTSRARKQTTTTSTASATATAAAGKAPTRSSATTRFKPPPKSTRSQINESQTLGGTDTGSMVGKRPSRAAAARATRSVSVMSDDIEDDDDAFDPAPPVSSLRSSRRR
ncbi:Double-strand break repair protein mus-23 [Blastomyces dermatitidis]|uniref:Double-strand break repair protein n=3 Tax=Blastomyces TaxID=229219 RepID=A0A179UBH3_BLAGS|nr:double-strand break repair protein MRE11 [Blastomyces gilchristii SLH14081]XP_031576591.1 double-strand break repair protein MRE11, variant 1 [Blastomyces gilchristii SLH14081]XP_031576592.1 double-strand break repair protein MRE11, variant 2 [Blastomyces gilchristii SLH14081]XP_045280959.1 double-strand break repair protein MRE11 [Blastomyces dermatitidis ER-3]XP_045280960.1 double-strand break repair protein MRE11, variant 1 [Blastomyces dermatitidis ER-3]XP_045280961.1 double-strand brea